MIIFSQGNTPHSRLANSITWYKDICPLLKDNGIIFYFPWAHEKQIKYLGENSPLIKNFLKANLLFEKSFRKKLNSKIISDESRMIEHRYEQRNKLKAFEWEKIIDYCQFREVLYLTGKIDLTDKNIINSIKQSSLTICHEPYGFDTSNIDYTQEFFKKSLDFIKPDIKLLNSCKRDISQKYKKNSKKIAVHIRGGDYAEWLGGEYCYPDDFWTTLITLLSKKFQNSPIYIFAYGISEGLKDFLKNKNNIIFLENSTADEDFVKTMLMDEIWAPVSTFNIAASEISQSCLGRHVKIKTLPAFTHFKHPYKWQNSANWQNFLLNI